MEKHDAMEGGKMERGSGRQNRGQKNTWCDTGFIDGQLAHAIFCVWGGL